MGAGLGGTLGVANSRGESSDGGGGGWGREQGVRFRPVGCPWHPDPREAVVGGELRSTSGEGGWGICHRFKGTWGTRRGAYRASCAGPAACCVILGAVGASGGGGNTAVEYWPEVTTFGAGQVGTTVLSFGIGAGVEGTDGGILATGFHLTKPPTGLALLGGG